MLPVRRVTAAVESLCFPVVVPTRPQGGCDPVVPLPIFRGLDFLAVDDPEVIVSGRESKVAESDVSHGICMEPDVLPVVMSTNDVEPLAVPVVTLTRSLVEGPVVVALPVNVEAISRALVYPDLLSGRVIKSVDPDV